MQSERTETNFKELEFKSHEEWEKFIKHEDSFLSHFADCFEKDMCESSVDLAKLFADFVESQDNKVAAMHTIVKILHILNIE